LKNQRTLPVDVDFIICCLFTLASSNQLFRNIDLKKDIYLGIGGGNYLLSNVENFTELSTLLNKSSLRQFAYFLLKPFLSKQNFSFQDRNKNTELTEQTIVFKKYLKKFKYFYKRYFFVKNENYNLLPTEKEMNLFATESLFFVLGI